MTERVAVFRPTVCGWMCVGLALTAATAHVVVGSPAIMQARATNHILGVGAFIVGLGLVLYLAARIQKTTDLPNADRGSSY